MKQKNKEHAFMHILATQQKFDKDIPVVFGNAEYKAEREMLIVIDEMIGQSNIEKTAIEYFIDTARANKVIEVFGTDKPARLTAKEFSKTKDDAILALRASILRKRLKLSLRKFALALSHSDLYKWFCRINRFLDPTVPGKSRLGDLENGLPVNIINQLQTQMLRSAADESSGVLYEPIDFSQCYMDSTCIKANIHFPVDWLLLRDSTRTMMLAVERIRQLGLKNRMPYEAKVFICKMNGLCMQMTFARRRKDSKRKRKAILRKMKNLLKKVATHSMRHFKLLDENWETVGISRRQAEQILKQISNVMGKLTCIVKCAHERIIGERRVANKDKLLSIYEEDVHVIVRHKSGAEVEFGNTLLLAEQDDGLIVDWKLFIDQAPADSRLLQNCHQRIAKNLDIDVELIAGDRGFDSKANQEYIEGQNIFNAVAPRSPKQLQQRLEEERFRQGQNRRSQTEARISILSHCFCGNPMRQKGFENREIHMGLSVLSHNLWVLARLKLAQQARLKQAA
jgi:hypothetical protein